MDSEPEKKFPVQRTPLRESKKMRDELNANVETEEVENIKSILHMLNDDCMLNVFAYLNFSERFIVSRVCKSWHSLCYQSWRNVKIFDLERSTWGIIPTIYIYITCTEEEPSERQISRLMPSEEDDFNSSDSDDFSDDSEDLSPDMMYPFLIEEKTKIVPTEKKVAIWNMKIVKKILMMCAGSLTKITLGTEFYNVKRQGMAPYYKWPTKWLAEFLKIAKNLKSVTVVEEPFQSQFLTLRCFPDLPNEKMKELDFSFNTEGKDRIYIREYILSFRIRRLILRYCQIEPEDLNLIPYKEHIEFFQIQFGLLRNKINANRLTKFLSQLVNVGYLEISGAEMDDNLLNVIAENCRQLVSLKLTQLDKVTNEGLLYLEDLQHLRYLEIHISRNIRVNIFKNFPNLRMLSISSCQSVMASDIIEIIQNSSTVEMINLSSTNLSDDEMKSRLSETLNRRGKQKISIITSSTCLPIVVGQVSKL